jgi:signal transduction histidine kinase
MGLRNRSIPVQVGILVAIPLLFLVAIYAVAATRTLTETLAQTRSTTLVNGLSLAVSDFQEEVVAERGLALLSLAEPPNPQGASQLSSQEAATGTALTALEAAYRSPSVSQDVSGTEVPAAMRDLSARAAGLGAIRRAVADRTVSLTAALADYDSVMNAGNDVIVAVGRAEPTGQVTAQALESVSLYQAEQAAAAESNLLAADIAQQRFPQTDRLTFAGLAATRQQYLENGLAEASPTLVSVYERNMPAKLSEAMTQAESAVQSTPWQAGVPPTSINAAAGTFGQYTLTSEVALLKVDGYLPGLINQQRHTERVEVEAAVAVGLLALIISVILSVLVGRGLVSQLRQLRESALTLAQDRLPGIIAKLRAGENVDVAEYEPGEALKGNEIAQVRHAFSVVQHAAIQSAVDEAQLRRGVSDVFRNLAGRNQSLLHRQLTLLDGMERRATEPDWLDDLYRIDHLTTRMRRHAESLIILSGDRPARVWRQPIRLVDVLRGAVAEVEDYTRIRVLCRADAAVAGHAVADLIHLLAELAENATVFSPPNTPVRMEGDVVGRGFAIEIEDRGLGISAARLEEINARLAGPPLFDLSGSDRLGLYVVSRLAQRHNIRVTLRPSSYGGTAVIVLVPSTLVVDENAAEPHPDPAAGQDDRPRPNGGAGGRHAALATIETSDGAEVSAGSGLLAPAGDYGIGHSASDSGIDYPAAAGDSGSSTRGRWFTRPTPTGGAAYDATAPGSATQPSWSSAPVRDDAASANVMAAAEIADFDLPVRVPQASLAPQLRNTPADAGAVEGGFTVPHRSDSGTGAPTAAPPDPAYTGPAGAPASPEEARAMVNALQRGWRLGRAVTGDAADQQDQTHPRHQG